MRRIWMYLWSLSIYFFPTFMQAQKIYTLNECQQMALQNNIKIKNGKYTIDQAVEQEKNAFSKYFPTISASGTYFHSNDELIKQKISLSSDDQQQLATIISQLGLDPTVLASMPSSYTIKAINHGAFANLMAMEPLYAGGQITAGNKLAKVQTEIRKLQLQQSQDEVVNTTELYYNQLLTLYEKRNTINKAEKQLDRIYQDAENAFLGGVKNKNDVLSVELKKNEVSTTQLKINNGIQLCKMVLAQYIGLSGEEIQIDTTLTDDLPDPSIYLTDHTMALNHLVEAQLLDKNVQANKLQTKLKKGALLPTVAIGAAGVYQDLSNTGHVKVIGLATVSVPISDWWGNNHIVRQQQIAERMAQQSREDNRQLLLIQMQSTYNDLTNAYKQIELAKSSLMKSAENLRLNEDYYRTGISTMSDLLDAQTQDQQAHDQYVEAVTQYLNSRTAYFISTGKNHL